MSLMARRSLLTLTLKRMGTAGGHRPQFANCGSTPETETAVPGLGGGDGDGAGSIGSDDGIAGLREDSAGLDENGRDAVALRDFECLAFVAGLYYTVHQLTVAHLIANCKRIHLPLILPHKCQANVNARRLACRQGLTPRKPQNR